MQIRISTRHGSLSDETQAKLTGKLEKLGRLFERLTLIEATIDLERRDAPTIDLKISAEHKHDFLATVQAGELMAACDGAIHKIEQQLRKYKQKIQDRHRSPAARPGEAPSEPAAG